jgi:PAS domain S-box-containing protein
LPAAILNALPAHVALLDRDGVILTVNEAWRRYASENALPDTAAGVGQNYLAVCERADTAEARQAAAGIRSVLRGAVPRFELEYPCPSPTEPRWAKLLATPLADAPGWGAVVMHIDVTPEKLAAIATQESEEKFQHMFTAAATGIAISTPQGRFLQANAAYCRMLGYTEDELRTRDFASLTHPDDLPLNLKMRDEILAGQRESFVLDKRYLKKGGEIVWTRHSVSAARTAGGEIMTLIVIAEDISESRRVEARYRRLAESGVQSVIFWNKRGAIIGANDTFLRLTGYTRQDLEAGLINWVKMTPPEHTAADDRALQELAARGTCTAYEKEWIRRDGSRVPVLIGSATFEDNEEEGVCFALDLTERVRMEQSLRASEQRFKALFEQAAVGVAQVDAVTGRYVHVNRRFGEILGRTREELEQLTAADITHPPTRDRDRERVRPMTAGDLREFTVEKRYLRKDGGEVWASVTVSEMWPQGAKPDYYLAIIQDVTTRKKLEDQFRQAQKMEAMGTLAGGIAHDFNNILASIIGYTELAQKKSPDNPAVRDHHDAVLRAARRAAGLVRQILAFSRQEKLERAPIRLGPIVAESMKLLRATIPTTIEFTQALATDAPTVLADANQINQILMNLGTNAWHAMKDRPGQIGFRLERSVVDATHAAVQPRLRAGIYARISISDNGAGMDQTTVRRIFEPFFTTKPQGEGTGLGLAVVHGIMESHDGTVVVYSQPGEGTVFHLYFPEHAGAPPAAESELGAPPNGRGERILLVDDEDLLVKLGGVALTGLGYAVEALTRPADALELVRSDPSRFDLVLTDQTMPGMTGLTLAEEIRKLRPDLPIVLMTGYSGSLLPERIEAAGIRQLLLKPATLHELATTLQKALAPRPKG